MTDVLITPNCSSIMNKNKTIAAVLAIFVGGLGIHKFYLGKPFLGVLYLIFCWTAVPSIIALIEGIIYIASSEDDFNRKYNKAGK